MALTTEGKAESSKNIGLERTNSFTETEGTGQLKWEGKCGNLTSAFVILGVTVFSLAGGGEGSRQGGSSLGKRISMLISRDTSMTRDPLEV